MLAPRLEALRGRLDALKAGTPPPLSLWDRARALLAAPGSSAGGLEVLWALDADLERAGVHTAADARLLRELGAARGRLASLAQGLARRAEEALAGYEAAVAAAEHQLALEALEAGAVARLEAAFPGLARAVKVAAIFEGGPAPAFELYQRPAAPAAPAPARARLAVAEFFFHRAGAQVDDSARKRRDLELASELVLRMGADAQADRDRLRQLRVALGDARERARAASPVRSLDELVRHLRHSARRDPRTAYRSLEALYERATEAGDAEVARVASEALAALLPPAAAARAVEQEEARRALGWRGAGPAEGGRPLAPGGKRGPMDALGDVLTQLAFELDDDQRRALALAAGAARFFDVEDALAEELVEAETRTTRPVQRRVPYPTQTLSYEFTGSLEEPHHLVITQPNTLLHDLAAGRQMVRAYLEDEPPPRPRQAQKTAVRVYVLDASGSMHGARARFRDAILIAELNAIRVKARAGLPFDPLYFTFFNDQPTALQRVDSGEQAQAHLSRLFSGSLAEGQTDISAALASAFESIAQARGRDPYLARATAVLVTDGEDGVDLELVRRTRQPTRGLDIALSFISLGEENPDLKALVLEQRRAGGRAFYHHLSDAEIALAPTEFDSAWRTLFPAEAEIGPGALEVLLPHLEALEAIARGRPPPPPERSGSQFDTLFPEVRPRVLAAPSPGLKARLADMLDAIAEAAPLAQAERRASEAVELLLHLLKLYGLALPRYLEVVGEPSLHERALRLRLLCRMG